MKPDQPTPQTTPDDRRNLNPHAEAIVAMTFWCDEYASQRGGSMDFWDTLSKSEQKQCRETVDKILAARRA